MGARPAPSQSSTSDQVRTKSVNCVARPAPSQDTTSARVIANHQNQRTATTESEQSHNTVSKSVQIQKGTNPKGNTKPLYCPKLSAESKHCGKPEATHCKASTTSVREASTKQAHCDVTVASQHTTGTKCVHQAKVCMQSEQRTKVSTVYASTLSSVPKL